MFSSTNFNLNSQLQLKVPEMANSPVDLLSNVSTKCFMLAINNK